MLFSPLFYQKIQKNHKTKNVPHKKLEKEKWAQILVLVHVKWRNTAPKVERAKYASFELKAICSAYFIKPAVSSIYLVKISLKTLPSR